MLHTKYMDQWEGYLEAPLERRCHIRFKVKHEIYLVSNQSKKVFGFLHDISAGGISFEYIPTCKDQIDTREMNINLDGCNLHFYRLRAKCIFDFEIEEAYYSCSSYFGDYCNCACCLEVLTT